MSANVLTPETLSKLRELIEANFAGRDELYAAAETVDDAAWKRVCRRLADHLAGHATELEQILLGEEEGRFDPDDMQFLDFVSQRAFLEEVKERHGSAEILAKVEQLERDLKDRYSQALNAANERHAEGVLQRQREDVEFGEDVLRSMRASAEEKDAAQEEEQREGR